MAESDHQKFRRIFEPLFAKSFVAAYRLTGSPEDAEDLIQESYLKAFRAIDKYDESKGAPAAWLHTIIRNTFINDLKKKRLREAPLFDESAPERVAAPAEEGHIEQSDGSLQKILDSLPAESRLLLVAREVNSLTYAELAKEFGLAEGTVKSRLNRARALLREKWQRIQK